MYRRSYPNYWQIVWQIQLTGELAALARVEDVDHHADNQPDEEAQPGRDGQARHQQHAEGDAEDRRCKTTGSTEAAVPFRLAHPQDDDADRDQDEGEERADVGEIGERADVKQ